MTFTIEIEDAHKATLERACKEFGKTEDELAAASFRAFLVEQGKRQAEIMRLAQMFRTSP